MVCQITFSSPEYDEAVALRYEVLRKPLGLEYTTEQLAAEWNQIHIAAFDASGKMVGYLNLTPVSDTEIKMRQVAVAPEMQGKGVGAAMVAYSEKLARELNYKEITLHARINAVPFYLKLQYDIVGDEFEEVTIPHFKMRKATNS
ncbi:MAG: GNAT family N-acetyltransferase [Saprospiraceae bacterium]|nr:GNAT family N-acetyltransferase [Saprospiraceae bacterium]